MSTLMRLIAWPFTALFSLCTIILELIGRVFAAALGVIITAIGFILCGTVVLLPIGIPLVVLGILLIVRSIL